MEEHHQTLKKQIKKKVDMNYADLRKERVVNLSLNSTLTLAHCFISFYLWHLHTKSNELMAYVESPCTFVIIPIEDAKK